MTANEEWKAVLEMNSPFEDDPFEEMEEASATEDAGGADALGEEASLPQSLAGESEPDEAQAPEEEPESAQDLTETPALQNAQSDPAPDAASGTTPLIEAEDAQTAETRKRAEFEAAEAKRKAEWEAKQQEKRAARQAQLERIKAMNDQQLVEAATQKAGADTEKLTRRNMKECVCEHIQTLCYEDAAFAMLTLTPPKNMIRCFQYINRKAYEYVQDELKASGQRPGPGNQVYGCDIPDDLCYQWAEEYFRTPGVKEDEEEEEKFVPKTYPGASTSKSKSKTSAKKKPAEKPAPKPAAAPTEKKPEESPIAQLSLGDYAA